MALRIAGVLISALLPCVFSAPESHAATASDPTQTKSSWSETLEDWGQRANQSLFDFNQTIGRYANNAVAAIPTTELGANVGKAAGNLLLNWVNEPFTIIGYAAASKYEPAEISARRFVINTVRGWGGIYDVATAEGLTVPHIDFGLAMCARGVPAGPYVVLPVIGPRTLRDGLADLLVTNVIFYVALIPVIGVAPSPGVAATAIAIDEISNLAIARQIDSIPLSDVAGRGYEQVRAEYLASRTRRCDALSAVK